MESRGRSRRASKGNDGQDMVTSVSFLGEKLKASSLVPVSQLGDTHENH